uniref:Uncharacterized protein n=1 Tax=Trichuris muris TaxID=70415 RepID=A0A5S6Q911_TRIMR
MCTLVCAEWEMSDRQRVYYLTQANVNYPNASNPSHGTQNGPRFTIARHNPAAHPVSAPAGNLYSPINSTRLATDSHGSGIPVFTAIVGLPTGRQLLPSGVTCIKPLVLPKPSGLGSNLPSHDGAVTAGPRSNDTQQPTLDISSSAATIHARPSILRRKVTSTSTASFPVPQRRSVAPVESIPSQTAPATVVTVASDKLIYCVDTPVSSANVSTDKAEEHQATDNDGYLACSERKRPRKQQLSEFSDRPDRPSAEDRRGNASGRMISRGPKTSKQVQIAANKADETSSEEGEKRSDERKIAKAEAQKVEGPTRRRQLRLAGRDTKSSVRQHHFLFPEEVGDTFDPRSITDEEILQRCPIMDNVWRLTLVQDTINRYSTNIADTLESIRDVYNTFVAVGPKCFPRVASRQKKIVEDRFSKAVIACEMMAGALKNMTDSLSVLLQDCNLYHKPLEVDDSVTFEDGDESSEEDDQPGPSSGRRRR